MQSPWHRHPDAYFLAVDCASSGARLHAANVHLLRRTRATPTSRRCAAVLSAGRRGLADLDVPPETGGECERCGGRTEWVLDRSNGHSWLQCPGHCARVEPPNDSEANGAPAVTRKFAPSEAAPVSAARGPEIPAAAVSHQAAGAAGEAAEGAPWLARGRPPGPVRAATNSWLCVPLLHAAAGDLAPAPVAACSIFPFYS